MNKLNRKCYTEQALGVDQAQEILSLITQGELESSQLKSFRPIAPLFQILNMKIHSL